MRVNLRLAGAAWLLAGIVFLGAEALAAARFTPTYNYAVNYISELGVTRCVDLHGCSPLAGLMNAAFIASGGLFAAAAALASTSLSGRARWLLAGLGAAHAVGLVLVGIFHGGALLPKGLAGFHVLGAFLAIVCGNLAIGTTRLPRVLGAPTMLRRLGPGAAAAGLFGLVVLIITGTRRLGFYAFDGAWERLSVYTITLWELAVGAWLLIGGRSRA